MFCKEEKNTMSETCEECREETSYDDIITLKCDYGYEHSICNKCMKIIKKKARVKSL